MKTCDGKRPDFGERLARWCVRRRWLMLGIAVVLTVLAAWRAAQLRLNTDLVELLPQDSRAVTTLRRMDARIESLPSILVVIESPEREANRRFVDQLVVRLRSQGDPDIAEVEWGIADQRDFFRRFGYLYAALEDLQEVHARLQREILRRKNPAFVELSAENENLPAASALRKKASELLDQFPDDHFATRGGGIYAVVVRLKGSLLGNRTGEHAISVVQQAIEALGASQFHPLMKVGLTGNVVSGLAERRALEDDLKLATTVCTLLVALAMFLFFRSPGVMLSSIVPAGLGVLLALAFAQGCFGALNASTAFLGAIILGNGINYAIIQTARYEEERRRGLAPDDAAVAAVAWTWKATGIAALSAAVAYGALVTTSLRGFNQFGYIGAVGMLISWVATLTLLPAIWACTDRRRVLTAKGQPGAFTWGAGHLADLVASHPRALLLLGAILSALALTALPGYLRDPFEYDFRKLGNQSQARRAVEELSRKLDPIFGRTLSPGVVLLDRVEDARRVKHELLARDVAGAVLGRVAIIDDLLPGDAPTQAAKLAVLDNIRRLLDRNLTLLDGKERARLEELRPPDSLRVLSAVDLPLSLRRFFTERDGTVGRPVLYFPPTGVSVWDGRYLLRLAEVVESVRLDGGRTVHSSGAGVVFAAMLHAVVHDGPVVTLVAFAGTMLIVLSLSGWRKDTLVVLGGLLAGVLWMVGAAAAAGVRVNFLNFIALPITFGIAVDYGINLLQRERLEGVGGAGRSLATTGGAVALCSLTTIIGYGALLCAESHALRSFGALAIFGEISCLTVALLIVPAALILQERRP